MHWVNHALTATNVGEEYEGEHCRTIAIPNPSLLMEALDTANKMTQYAALKFRLYSGADIRAANGWRVPMVGGNLTPIDPDSEVLMHLAEGKMPRGAPRAVHDRDC